MDWDACPVLLLNLQMNSREWNRRINALEWNQCIDPDRMLWALWNRASARKLRHFAVECLRLNHDPRDEGFRDFIEAIGRFADGQASIEEVQEARYETWETVEFVTGHLEGLYLPSRSGEAATPNQLLRVISPMLDRSGYIRGGDEEWEGRQQCGLLREIFGPDPRRLVSVEPAWLTPTVLTMARGIYAENGFDLMPVLGDALEDAGCNDDGILAHCRQAEGHVRGCWVVDLLLGKE
jgi:hypothetical protein